MPRVQFLQVDVGGHVEHVVTDLGSDGAGFDAATLVPVYAGPTVELKGSDGSEVVASQLATVVAPTKLLAAVAAGATQITVPTTTGLKRFDQIVIGPSSDEGRWEWAMIDGLKASTVGPPAVAGTLFLLAPLRYAYGVNDVVGTRTLAVDFEDDEITEVQRNCRLIWTYQRSGVTIVENTVVHLSRYAPRYSLSDAEVEAVVPTALRMLGPHQRLTLIIRQVWERRVLPSIARLMNPGGLVTGEAADELLLAAVAQQINEAAGKPEQADRWRETYDGLLGGLQDTITDLDEDGEQATTEKPRSRNVARLNRG